ncbi:hypothetical protein Gohar_003309 [Gossypium harknessii]|uniref:Uncharacterized protein n=1 Tax=Gossypium harknessii TaxID=34285 RepID=A0A7J9HNI4_9ROSI|nr:hypothetical protein [Gossypium harknessii]
MHVHLRKFSSHSNLLMLFKILYC